MAEYQRLLPCPFCGNQTPALISDIADWPSVVCSTHLGGCGASSGHCSSGSSAEAIEIWNRRRASLLLDKWRERISFMKERGGLRIYPEDLLAELEAFIAGDWIA